MRYLGSMLALFALTTSVPAFASDYSPDRHSTERSVATARHEQAAPPSAQARRHAVPCTCACARHASHHERADAARVTPGGR